MSHSSRPHPPSPTRPPPPSTDRDIDRALADMGLAGSPQAAGIRQQLLDVYTSRDDVMWAITQGALSRDESTQHELQEALANSMMQIYLDDFLSRQTIDDATLQRHYAQYRQALGRTEYELRLMTLGSPAEAAAVIRKFAASKDFDGLARRHSIDALAPQGGYVGWVGEGSLAAETRQALTRLPCFQISQPIPAPEGTHLLLIEAVRHARPVPFNEIRSSLEQSARNERLAHHLAELRSQRSLQDRGAAS